MSRLKEILIDASLGIFYLILGTISMILGATSGFLVFYILGIVVIAIGVFYTVMGVVLGEADRK